MFEVGCHIFACIIDSPNMQLICMKIHFPYDFSHTFCYRMLARVEIMLVPDDALTRTNFSGNTIYTRSLKTFVYRFY